MINHEVIKKDITHLQSESLQDQHYHQEDPQIDKFTLEDHQEYDEAMQENFLLYEQALTAVLDKHQLERQEYEGILTDPHYKTTAETFFKYQSLRRELKTIVQINKLLKNERLVTGIKKLAVLTVIYITMPGM